MMTLHSPAPRRKPESTIALINVVFLMLIFFLIAGALTPPIDSRINLIKAMLADPAGPPDALALRADGTMTYHGQETTLDARVAAALAAGPDGTHEGPVLRILADRDLPATQLLDVVAGARERGIANVLIVTERARQ